MTLTPSFLLLWTTTSMFTKVRSKCRTAEASDVIGMRPLTLISRGRQAEPIPLWGRPHLVRVDASLAVDGDI